MARNSKANFPRWLVALGLTAAALLAYVGTRGGPDQAWLELSEAFGYIEPPKIVSIQPKSVESLLFVVSIENPSLRRIQVTGYEASPSIEMALAIDPAPGAGSLPVMKIESGKPRPCLETQRVQIAVPLVIEPGSSGGLMVMPWSEKCDFSITIRATTGTSRKAYWTPGSDTMLSELKKSDRPTFDLLVEASSPEMKQHLERQGIYP